MSFRKIVGLFGLIILVVSVVAHLLTYRNINPAANYPAVWGLFPLVILVFLFTVITLYLKIGNRAGIRAFYKATLALMPKWTWIILLFFFSYLIFNSFWLGTGLAVPDESEGKYTINNHGKITEYTLQETEAMKLNQFRQFSAFLIWLLLCSTLYLLTAKENDDDVT